MVETFANNNINTIQYIKIAETVNQQKFLCKDMISEINLNNPYLLLKFFDELETFYIKDDTFFANENDLSLGEELRTHSIYFSHPVDGLIQEIKLVKKLVWGNISENVYEARIDSETHIYRIFMFPHSQMNSYFKEPFVVITYSLDKKPLKSNEEANELTNQLRDSSSRIKKQFIKNKEYIQCYLIA